MKGLTLTAKNSSYVFHIGYAEFFQLRATIASLYDKCLGEHYWTLPQYHDKQTYDEFDRITEEILAHPRFKEEDSDILDFLYASDCDGKIGYKTCKKIRDLLQASGSTGQDGEKASALYHDYRELREFLGECYSHRRTAYWI